jgi:radical SAM protein with 4Fe4S-binding SPASM domain
MLNKISQLIQLYTFDARMTPPKTIFIELTGACNLRCPGCARTYSDGKRGHMSDEMFHLAVDQIAASYPNVESLGFHFFGEIELRKDFHVLTSTARRKLPSTRLGISTTLTSQDRDVVRNLLFSGVHGIGVWPDGYSEESYALIRPGSSFKLVKENIIFLLEEREKLQRTDIGIGIGMVKNALNKAHAGDFYREFAFVKNYRNADLVTVDSHDWAGQVPSDGMLRSTKKYALKVRRPCAMVFTNLIINADGDLSLCCMDMNMKLKIGNLREDGIGSLWRSDRAARIRRSMKRLSPLELCTQCHNFYFGLSLPAARARRQRSETETNGA